MACCTKNAKTETLLKQLDEIQAHLAAYSYASAQISFQGETQDPPLAMADRGETLATLDELRQNVLCDPKTHKLLLELDSRRTDLEPWRADQVRILLRDYDEIAGIPPQENAEFTRLLNEASHVWHNAKGANDWDSFAPYLDKIVATMKKFAHIKDPNKAPYDVCLDMFEKGSSMAFYDDFFAKLKSAIVPLVHAIQEKNSQPDTSMFKGHFDHDRQMKLARKLADFEGLNLDALVIAESLHPFTNSLTSNHVFITTAVDENDVISNVYSVLHEGGHALYEQQVNPQFNRTALYGGTSLGIHESISRFFENIVGKSRGYADHLLRLVSEEFPEQMQGISADDWYKAVNVAEPSLIRTEADELTYALHIMVRYELEKALFEGTLTAKDVPAAWKAKYKEYLGIDVPNDAQGALQDTHWSIGLVGYFPTYALGSAYGAQYVHAMRQQGIDVDSVIASGDTTEIRTWLHDNIWVYGRSKDPNELILNACGEPFDAQYFCDYLKEKFSALYNL